MTEERNCSNCYYRDKGTFDHPCETCEVPISFSAWHPQTEAQASNAEEKNRELVTMAAGAELSAQLRLQADTKLTVAWECQSRQLMLWSADTIDSANNAIRDNYEQLAKVQRERDELLTMLKHVNKHAQDRLSIWLCQDITELLAKLEGRK